MLFGEADLEQSSKHALKHLKMQDNHHVNHYMISFLEHALYMHWNKAALYDTFYAGLAKRLKDQLLTVETTLEDLKRQSLCAIIATGSDKMNTKVFKPHESFLQQLQPQNPKHDS